MLIITFAAQRISGGTPTGLGIVDRPLSTRSMLTASRVALVLLSIGAGFRYSESGISAPRPCGTAGSS